MIKNIILISFLALSGGAFAQVGINNEDPKATLDITAKTTDGSKPEGIIAPRLTGDQIKAADAQFIAAQTGAMVFATSAVGTSTAKTINITTPGYYFFNGTVWLKVNDIWRNDTANTQIKLGTLSNGTSARTAGTEFVVLDTGYVGIGATTGTAPNSTLQVSGSFSLPIRTVSVASTILDSDYNIIGPSTGGGAGISITLPDPTTRKGRMYNFVYDGGNFTIAGLLRVEGANVATYSIINSRSAILFQSDGTRWIAINRSNS